MANLNEAPPCPAVPASDGVTPASSNHAAQSQEILLPLRLTCSCKPPLQRSWNIDDWKEVADPPSR
eukprot:GDKH01025202.1.p1 GENE.GDKH01025202.1~~GDKH01025202.1.p1  ORF type:complete len:66 (+),score=0.80 GDKH01025202.1:199-396(+)